MGSSFVSHLSLTEVLGMGEREATCYHLPCKAVSERNVRARASCYSGRNGCGGDGSGGEGERERKRKRRREGEKRGKDNDC